MDVRQIVSALTLEEKAGLCSGADSWHTKAIEREGVPSIKMSDGPHGLRVQDHSHNNLFLEAHRAVCYPSGSALGASFNRELLHDIGGRLGAEAQAMDVQTILGPAVNMKRSPLCGRNFEYFAEDPHLAGELAAAYVNGVQSQGIGACIKHFAVNNQEYRRMSVSARVSERALREIYLPAFETAVKKSQPWAVMCSYNRINSVYACENEHLLTEILRKEWGFQGIVMTDWGAMNRRREALLAGLNLEMPSSNGENDKKLVQAVRDGLLAEADLDRIVEELLTWINKNLEGKRIGVALDLESDHAFARSAAAECAVLLKNENALLPLSKTETVAFIGGFAAAPRYQGSGSSHINSFQVDNALSTARQFADVIYAEGFSTTADAEDPDLFAAAIEAAKAANAAVIFAGLPDSFESEGYDRRHLDLPACQNRLISAVAAVQPRTVVVLHNGSPVTMPWLDKVSAVLEMYLAGEAAGAAAADLLFGDVSPSGKLAETFPARLEDTPSFLNFPGNADTVDYAEDVYIGYRWYDARKIPALFPFGHGLSYTSFSLEDITIDRQTAGPEDLVHVTVKLKNMGDRSGKEVVQLYIAPPADARFCRPVKELKGFQKVLLGAGEEAEVTFELNYRAFSYYHEGIGDWYAEPGAYTILVGTSSADLPLKKTVDIKSPKLPLRYTDHTTCEEIWSDGAYAKELDELAASSAFWSPATANGGDSMARAMLESLPVHSFVSFGVSQEKIDRFQELIDNHALCEESSEKEDRQ